MRILIAVAAALILSNFSCRKSEEQKEEEEIALPATINGTVDYIEVKNIYQDIEIAHEGVVYIKTSNGKRHSFTFLYLGAPTYIGNGQYFLGEDNSTVTFDTASLLLPSSIVNAPILQASTYYSNIQVPNAIHIKFNDKAQVYHSKGAKEINASFTSESKLLVSFFSINDDNQLAAQYEADRDLSISRINELLQNLNHDKGDNSKPPSRTWVFYNE